MMKHIYLGWMLLCLSVITPLVAIAQEPFPATIRVTVEPEATLTLDHKPFATGRSFQLNLPPDRSALLELSAPGYLTAYRVLNPSSGERRHESFTLKRIGIPVLFRCNVEAMVLCDGQELGRTPFSTFFTEPKAHRIVFRATGYEDHAVRLNLENGKPQVVNVELASDSAVLHVASDPAGASVSVNGVPRGVTPCTLPRLREGEHLVEVRQAGYYEFKQQVTLHAGDEQKVQAVLRKLPAGLTIVASQPDAMVFINNVSQGRAPLTFKDVTEGVYRVRVEAAGFKPLEKVVRLASGQTHEERFELSPCTGIVKVRTQPATVQIWVDGRKMAETKPEAKDSFTSAEVALTLTIGQHTLVFKADGYADMERVITVKEMDNVSIRQRLNFAPNFEIRTQDGAIYRGVLVRQEAEGAVTLELRPGMYRTFSPTEIRSKNFWSE